MPQIELKLSSHLFIPKFLPYLTNYMRRFEFWYGGAGSGKSYTITQKLIIRCCNEKIRVLVCRRYGSTLRNSCFSLFKEVLTKWRLTNYVKIRETDFAIVFPNGSEIIMIGLDDEQKLLSLNNIGTIWVEEAFEVNQEIIEQLNLRMRATNPNQQIIMSWNPIAKSSWLYNFVVVNPPASSVAIHSTFKDNCFLPQSYIEAMEEMRVRNPNKAHIYYWGEWGNDPEGLVFTNWRAQEFDAATLASQGLQHRTGSDFGFIDPSTVVDTLYDEANKTIYVFNEYYKKGCQLDEMYEALKQMGLAKAKIYFDSAEPRSIDFFRRQGVQAMPCIKGKDSVNARIAFLQNHLIIISPNCKNTINDFENFSYVKDKRTNNYTETTTHEFSHTIDALGYAYSDIYTKSKLKSFDKSILGI